MQNIKYIFAGAVVVVLIAMGIKISSLEKQLMETDTVAVQAGINAMQPIDTKLMEGLIQVLGQGGILTSDGQNIIVNPILTSALAPQVPQGVPVTPTP